MASAVLFVELAAGRLRKLERMAWPFAQGSVENRHHAGDKLVSTSFLKSWTRGFAAVDEPNVAVCLLPGTELAFEENLMCEAAYGFSCKRLPHKVARFRQINKDRPHAHHDALELPDGQIVLLTKLAGGQHATVLQLPASPSENMPETEQHEQVIEIIPADW